MGQARIHAEQLGGETWAEVDDPNDLENADYLFAPDRCRRHLESSWGGYWNHELLDFAFIRNTHFPPDSPAGQHDAAGQREGDRRQEREAGWGRTVRRHGGLDDAQRDGDDGVGRRRRLHLGDDLRHHPADPVGDRRRAGRVPVADHDVDEHRVLRGGRGDPVGEVLGTLRQPELVHDLRAHPATGHQQGVRAHALLGQLCALENACWESAAPRAET
ncbi:hypothetical protein HX744_27435 [Pseudonocardia sp. ICBG1122]|nr:hypothetical protein [Pseudonocardia pini]